MPEPLSPFKRVRKNFNQDDLKRICEMHERDFIDAYGMTEYVIEKRVQDNYYLFKDNGSSILAVAHLDTVIDHTRRTANFVDTEAGPVVFSGALDDRLGAYTILELMPKLGLEFDWLLTVGEEQGRSTAEFFETEKDYHWMIEFDRGGKDVVMYQYDDAELRDLVRSCGARPADGAFSDISYLEHLEIKGLNWGVGYQNYHGPRGHAFLEDYWEMIGYFLKFHESNHDVYLPHDKRAVNDSWWGGRSSSSLWSSDYDMPTVRYSSAYSQPGLSRDVEDDDWLNDEDVWTDAHWDAYIEGGIEAVRAMGLPDAEDPDPGLMGLDEYGENPEPEPIPDVEIDDEMVSDDFIAVNRALTAASSED